MLVETTGVADPGPVVSRSVIKFVALIYTLVWERGAFRIAGGQEEVNGSLGKGERACLWGVAKTLVDWRSVGRRENLGAHALIFFSALVFCSLSLAFPPPSFVFFVLLAIDGALLERANERENANSEEKSESRTKKNSPFFINLALLAPHQKQKQLFTFFANSWISSKFRLDSVLCLVDAQHIAKIADERSPDALDEAVNQIAFADTILLNKIDLVTPEELQTARNIVRSVNMTANLIECQLADPPPMVFEKGEKEAGGAGNAADATPSATEEKAAAAAAAITVNGGSNKPAWEQLMDVNSFSIERALQVDPTFMDDEDEQAKETSREREESGEEEGNGDGGDNDEKRDGQPASAKGPASGSAEENEAEPAPSLRRSKRSRGGSSAKEEVEEKAAEKTQPKKLKKGAEKAELAPHGHAKPMRSGSRSRLHNLAGVSSVGISAAGPLDQYRFNMFMKDLLLEKSRDIMRCKGVLCIKGQEKTKFVFQGVHDTVCFGPSAAEWGAEDGGAGGNASSPPPVSQIVFIGRDLDRAMLSEGFKSCVWQPLPEGWAEHRDQRTGRPYYHHEASGTKQWSRPCAASAEGATTTDGEEGGANGDAGGRGAGGGGDGKGGHGPDASGGGGDGGNSGNKSNAPHVVAQAPPASHTIAAQRA